MNHQLSKLLNTGHIEQSKVSRIPDSLHLFIFNLSRLASRLDLVPSLSSMHINNSTYKSFSRILALTSLFLPFQSAHALKGSPPTLIKIPAESPEVGKPYVVTLPCGDATVLLLNYCRPLKSIGSSGDEPCDKAELRFISKAGKIKSIKAKFLRDYSGRIGRPDYFGCHVVRDDFQVEVGLYAGGSGERGEYSNTYKINGTKLRAPANPNALGTRFLIEYK